MDVRRLAREERAEFAAFLATLPPPQWQAPTLCARWRVRDVVAHVISYHQISVHSLLALAARCQFRPGRVNAAALARYDTRSPEQLLALLADHLQARGLPAALGAGSPGSRPSFITRTSGAPSDGRVPSRQNGCCPRCVSR